MFIILRTLLFITPLLALFITYNLPWNATFSIDAKTNIVSLSTGEQVMPRWWVEDVSIFTMDDELSFSGQIEIEPNVSITFTQLNNEKVQVELISADRSATVAKLYAPDDTLERTIAREMYLEISTSSAQQSLPIVGNITAGQLISAQSFGGSPILKEGTVSILGKSLVSEEKFAAGRADLQAGDRLQVVPAKETDISVGYGLISMDNASNNLNLTYHSFGEKVQVSRYGSEGYTIRPSIPARITSDPVLQTLAILYAALWPLVGFRSWFRQ